MFVRTFDPNAELSVIDRHLPHWSQAGTIAFITWRTHDSMPSEVIERWDSERRLWLKRFGIDSGAPEWRSQLASLSTIDQQTYRRQFAERWHEALDESHGECVLRRPELASIVADSLRHFDGERYELCGFVVMPNHVHVLAAFADDREMLRQCESWKHFQAAQLNRRLGRTGRFWQPDDFDHLVRSVEQFEYLQRYIALNGPRAGLKSTDYFHYTKKSIHRAPRDAH